MNAATGESRSAGDYVVMMDDGERYSHTRFKDNVWEPAFGKARVEYARPYCDRRTFAAWAMTIGTDLTKLERLMEPAQHEADALRDLREVCRGAGRGLRADTRLLRRGLLAARCHPLLAKGEGGVAKAIAKVGENGCSPAGQLCEGKG